MRLNGNLERGVTIWLLGSDKHLFGLGESFEQARQRLKAETAIAIGMSTFRRIAMYLRTTGRLRWWRGFRPPLPITEQAGDAAMSLLFEAADLRSRLPDMDFRREPPAFVARLLCESGFRCSPSEAALGFVVLNTTEINAA